MEKRLRRNTTLFVASIVVILLIQLLPIKDTSILPWMWVLVFVLGGFAKAEEGLRLTLKNKSLNVEFLMILAAIGAAIIGYYSEGAILILIFSLSGILEQYSMIKAQKTLTSLLNLAPEKATLIEGDQEVVVDAASLAIGQIIRVNVGQQIPADGTIVSGDTHVDQASITGESVAVFKQIGDEVFAGTMNLSGSVTIEVAKNPSEFLVKRMVDFVTDAQENKTVRQSSIDKFEAMYVYVVLLIAALLMITPPLLDIWSVEVAIYRGIVFLVVASPCALVASSAPAMLSAMSWGGKNGILIKGSQPMELLSKTDLVIFDKTGTLTYGKPVIKEFTLDDKPEEKKHETLEIIYAMESQSSHPLAKEVVEYLRESVTNGIEISIKEIAGHGVEAVHHGDVWQLGRFDYNENSFSRRFDNNGKEGYSIIKIVRNRQLIGYFLLQDMIREEATSTVDKLHHMNVKTLMLTGDHNESVAPLLEKVAIDDYRSDLLPQDKSRIVEEMKTKYQTVAMIGDGINDAPSLAIADVGVAMGGATDVALETADIVFMNDNLENTVKVIKLAKKARRIVNQNVVFSMSILAVLVILNVFQLINLPFGVFFHEGSTIVVILNGLRLLQFDDKA